MPYIDYGSTVAVCVSHWGSYCNIEAARSPLLYRRSWLLSLGTPEQNFSGLSQMIYDIFHCKVIIGRNPIEANANTVAIQLPGNPVAYIGHTYLQP